mgnify:FL=1
MNSLKIENKDNLIEILAYNEENIIDAINDKENTYFKYKLRKKNGTRDIYGLKKDNTLYHLQRNLNTKVFKNILFPECVYGFCKHKSYFDFLAPHISKNKKRYYLRLDISKFFDSIKIDDIYQSLSYYISNDISGDEKDYIIQLIIDIATLNEQVIQGAITSPIISNLVFRSLDIRIERYCKRFGINYTRYADDMLFSSTTNYIHNYKFSNAIQYIISDKGFYLNHHKTLKFKDEISLNGFVIGTNIHLSRKKYNSINKIIFTLSQSTFTGFSNRRQQYIIKNKLAGYRSFLIQSSRYTHDEQQKLKIENKINTIQKLILKYCV